MRNLFELYEIDRRLYDLVDPETGELMDEDAFEILQMERSEKIEGLILWSKNTAAGLEAMKKEAEVLEKRRQALAALDEKLRRHIQHFLGGEPFSTPRCSVSFRASSSVEIEDVPALIRWAEETGHSECLSYKPPSVLKTALRDMLKSGVGVPGVHIERKKNMVVK